MRKIFSDPTFLLLRATALGYYAVFMLILLATISFLEGSTFYVVLGCFTAFTAFVFNRWAYNFLRLFISSYKIDKEDACSAAQNVPTDKA